MRRYLPLAFLVPLALAACSKPAPLTNEEVEGDNSSSTEIVPPDEGGEAANAAADAGMPPINTVDAVPDITPPVPAQQLQDDADATGMTAQLPPPDTGVPAQQQQQEAAQDRR